MTRHTRFALLAMVGVLMAPAPALAIPAIATVPSLWPAENAFALETEAPAARMRASAAELPTPAPEGASVAPTPRPASPER